MKASEVINRFAHLEKVNEATMVRLHRKTSLTVRGSLSQRPWLFHRFQPITIKDSLVKFKILSGPEADTASLILAETKSELEKMSNRIIQVSNVPTKVNGITVQKEHLNMIFTEGFGSGQGYDS